MKMEKKTLDDHGRWEKTARAKQVYSKQQVKVYISVGEETDFLPDKWDSHCGYYGTAGKWNSLIVI